MKSVIITILLFILPICVMAQESQFDQNYREGEKLFDNKEYNKAYTILIEAAAPRILFRNHGEIA